MSTDVYFPRAKFTVHFQYTSLRAFSQIDQTILQLLKASQALSVIPEFLGLPRRIVVESAFDLLKEQMLQMTASSLSITPKGEKWVERLTEYHRRPIHQGKADIYYDWNSGATDVCLNLEKSNQEDTISDEFFDLFYLSPKETSKNQEKIFYLNKDYSSKDWKKRAEILQFNFGSVKMQVEVVLRAALKSKLHREKLKLFEMEPLSDGFNNYYRYGYKSRLVFKNGGDSGYTKVPEVCFEPEEWLLSTGDHCRWLQQALRKAHSNLLVFSAHQSAEALEEIQSDFSQQVNGSFLVLGFYKKMDTFKCHGGLQYIADEKSNSDMKIVIYEDEDGIIHLALGSFNWLRDYRNPESFENENEGIDISILLQSQKHDATMISVIEAIRSQVEGYSDSVKKSELLSVLHSLRKRMSSEENSSFVDETMFIAGSTISGECGNALRNAKERCLVLSHTLHEKLDPLKILKNREVPVSSFCLIAFSYMYGKDDLLERGRKASDECTLNFLKSQKKRIRKCGTNNIASLEIVRGMHARLIVTDDIVTVTFLNCLSSFDTTNAFGIRFRDKGSAIMFEELGKQLLNGAATRLHDDTFNEDDNIEGFLNSLNPDQRELFKNLSSDQRENLFSRTKID